LLIVFTDNFAGTRGDEYYSVQYFVWVVLGAAYLKFLASAGSEHILPMADNSINQMSAMHNVIKGVIFKS
jgi:hypothetical protein